MVQIGEVESASPLGLLNIHLIACPNASAPSCANGMQPGMRS